MMTVSSSSHTWYGDEIGRERGCEMAPFRVLPLAGCDLKPAPSGCRFVTAWASGDRSVFAAAPRVSAMASQSQQLEGRDGTLSRLNVAIDVMNPAKGISVIAPAQAAFGSVSAILTMIRV